MKFKVGDKVKVVNKTYGEIVGFNVLTVHSYKVKLQSGRCVCCMEHELELYEEPQTEFRLEDIAGNAKPGIYKAVDKERMLQKIIKLDNGFLEFHTAKKDDGFSMKPLEDKFVFQEPKKAVVIYSVEHRVNGTLYSFISSQLLEEGQFVICDTKHAGSYGKIVYLEFRELTEEEIKQYKECWRA